MDDQMKNIIRNEPSNLCADLVILSAFAWENTNPTFERRAEKELAIGFFRNPVKGLLNCIRVFSSDMD